MRNPDWSKYRNGETVQFLQLFIKIVKSYDLQTLLLYEHLEPIETKFRELEQAYKKPTGSTVTKELVRLDKARGLDIRALEKAVAFYSLNFKTEKVIASDVLSTLLKKYGPNIHRQKYNVETALVRNLYKDYETIPEIKLAIDFLDLTSILEHLNHVNIEFESLFLARNKKDIPKKGKNFSELKSEVVLLYKVFAKTLESRAFMSTDGSYDFLIEELNILVLKFNSESRSRTKKESTNLKKHVTDSKNVSPKMIYFLSK